MKFAELDPAVFAAIARLIVGHMPAQCVICEGASAQYAQFTIFRVGEVCAVGGVCEPCAAAQFRAGFSRNEEVHAKVNAAADAIREISATDRGSGD